MKHRTLGPEQETLAALYALGSLDAAEARDFERHLADDDCDVCRRQVDTMAGVCGDLAIAPSPATPPPAVRSRILREIGADAPASAAYTSRDDGEWIELKPGLSVKLTGPTGVVNAGDTARYEITVRNVGSLPSTNVQVVGTLPSDTKPTMKTAKWGRAPTAGLSSKSATMGSVQHGYGNAYSAGVASPYPLRAVGAKPQAGGGARPVVCSRGRI